LPRNDVPGQPAAIPAFPPLTFSFILGYPVPSGTYRVGVTCTLFGEAAHYWDTEIVIASSAGKAASDLLWRLPSLPASVNKSAKDSDWQIELAVLGLVVVIGSSIFWRRSRSARLSKERS
jgi:hypothetical protein